jgi:hypothetical protein
MTKREEKISCKHCKKEGHDDDHCVDDDFGQQFLADKTLPRFPLNEIAYAKFLPLSLKINTMFIANLS